MSYLIVARIANDQSLLTRVTACSATLGDLSPGSWAQENMWHLSASPGWVEAYRLSVESGVSDPGADESAITDAMILAAVEDILASESTDNEKEDEVIRDPNDVIDDTEVSEDGIDPEVPEEEQRGGDGSEGDIEPAPEFDPDEEDLEDAPVDGEIPEEEEPESPEEPITDETEETVPEDDDDFDGEYNDDVDLDDVVDEPIEDDDTQGEAGPGPEDEEETP